MAIPDYRAWLDPLLAAVADGQEHEIEELNERLADKLGVTQEERRLKTACNRQLMYKNRQVMARTQLIRSGLLKPGERKRTVQITELGLEHIRQAGLK